MPLQSPVPGAVGTGAATLLSFVLAVLTAVVAVRLSVRTRFFEARAEPDGTWHGRPLSRDDHEPHDGFNPAIVFFVTFLGSMLVYLVVFDALLAG